MALSRLVALTLPAIRVPLEYRLWFTRGYESSGRFLFIDLIGRVAAYGLSLFVGKLEPNSISFPC